MKYNFGQLFTNAFSFSNATYPSVVQESAFVFCSVAKAIISESGFATAVMVSMSSYAGKSVVSAAELM